LVHRHGLGANAPTSESSREPVSSRPSGMLPNSPRGQPRGASGGVRPGSDRGRRSLTQDGAAD
jgi:hypothetical protein